MSHVVDPDPGRAALRRPRRRRGPGLLLQSLQLASIAYLASIGGLLWWSHAPMLVGWQPKVVLTGSMLPVIRPGDVALVGPGDAHAEGLPPGRIVLVTAPDRETGTYLHRIVRYEKNSFLVTKGDANPTEDHPAVDPDRVRGQVRLLVPAIGRPVVWLHDHRYLALGGSLALTWFAMACALAVRGDADDERPAAATAKPRAVPPPDAVVRPEPVEKPDGDVGATLPVPPTLPVRRPGRHAPPDAAAAAVVESPVVLPDGTGSDAALPTCDPSHELLRDLVLPEGFDDEAPFVPAHPAVPAEPADLSEPTDLSEPAVATGPTGAPLSAEAERLVLDLDAFEAAFGSAFGADDGEDVSDFDGRGFDR